jgi:SAM-dependent methyltransferase
MALAIGRVVIREVPELAKWRVYEASARGPFYEFLRRNAGELVCSEFYDDVRPGQAREGIECQDLQALTYPDAHFDLCTSLEVFEHVPDDGRGFAELHRVLRPGGLLIFTVPLSLDIETTVERARIEGGEIVHLRPPTYHDDQIRGEGRVLVYRDYGTDIVQRLEAVGFCQARIVEAGDPSANDHRLPVLVARKAATEATKISHEAR